jgi:hypothetical protein
VRVVRHEQVHPAVAVEIEHGDAESFDEASEASPRAS